MLPQDEYGVPVTHEDGKTTGKINPFRIVLSKRTDKGCVVTLKDDPTEYHLNVDMDTLVAQAQTLASFNPVGHSMRFMPGSMAEKLNEQARKTGERARWVPFPARPMDVAMHLDEGIFMTRQEIKSFKGQWEKAVLYKPGIAREQNRQFEIDAQREQPKILVPGEA